jgi:hypothetical protein
MKTFLGAIASVAVATAFALGSGGAIGGCSSDDGAPTAATNPGNVVNGGACTQGAQCQSGVCGFPIADTCKATGVCIVQSTCAVHTYCPCGGGPAFSECDDGLNAGQAVTGSASCIVDAAAAEDAGDASVVLVDGGDAGDASTVTDGGSGDAGDGGSDGAVSDAGLDAAGDAAADASDAAVD